VSQPEALLRVLARAAPGDEAEEQLRARFAELFPLGYEEERRGDGRLLLAAYAGAPLELPDGLGGWRIETVARGWEHRWREFHHGAQIAGRLWVGPPWERPPAGLAPVVIDPGRAFGTGQHGTTAGCLELLCRLAPRGSVLDLGCGSGVLAIAAARLGFSPVLACDNDQLAIAATRLNAGANDVVVEAFAADVLHDELPDAELWLANILHGPLVELFARPRARPQRAIVSGLRLHESVVPSGYREAARVERDGWLAVLLERQA
jgi:ribosomal protein L11 methyltransferase